MSTPILTVAPTGTWNLDAVHSRVDFEVSYLAGTFKGEFHEIGAELNVDAERASLEGTAKVASVSGTFGTGGVAAVNGSSNNWTAIASVPQPPALP